MPLERSIVEVTAKCRFNVQVQGKDRSPSGERAERIVSAHQYDGEVPNQAARKEIDILVPFTEPLTPTSFLPGGMTRHSA
jgi:hypothetical protein